MKVICKIKGLQVTDPQGLGLNIPVTARRHASHVQQIIYAVRIT